MSGTKIYYFSGIGKWAKVHTPDDYKGDKRYTLDLYPDDESLDLYKDSGMQGEIRTDEDGEFVKFRRPVEKLINGTVVNFGKPNVVDENGNPITDLIGNGSEVIAKVSVYDTDKGVGHRLESVMVKKLVPYEGKGGPVEEIKPDGLADLPDF